VQTLYTALMTTLFYLLVVLLTSHAVTENESSDKSKLMVGNGDPSLVCPVAHQQV
jgi:hypothetical protein